MDKLPIGDPHETAIRERGEFLADILNDMDLLLKSTEQVKRYDEAEQAKKEIQCHSVSGKLEPAENKATIENMPPPTEVERIKATFTLKFESDKSQNLLTFENIHGFSDVKKEIMDSIIIAREDSAHFDVGDPISSALFFGVSKQHLAIVLYKIICF